MEKNEICGYYALLDKNKNHVGYSIFDDNFATGFPNLVRLYDVPCVGMSGNAKAVLVRNEEEANKYLNKNNNNNNVNNKVIENNSKVKQISSYAKAEYSLITKGPVSLTVLENRKEKCLSCSHLIKKPEIDEIGFCGACGCGERKRAGLSIKIQMPDSECPIKKWEKAEGIGVEHLTSRMGGRSKQIIKITENVVDEGKNIFKKYINNIKNIFKNIKNINKKKGD